jgi:hypothetical protein
MPGGDVPVYSLRTGDAVAGGRETGENIRTAETAGAGILAAGKVKESSGNFELLSRWGQPPAGIVPQRLS